MAAGRVRGADPDRYLERRKDGRWRYKRRVPRRFAAVDERAFVRMSLHTDDLPTARLRRDAQEQADNEYWAGLAAGGPAEAARRRYQAARARAGALGFRYAPAAEIAASEPLEALIARLDALRAIGGEAAPMRDVEAVTGLVDEPRSTVSEAFDVYVAEIAAGEKRAKSPAQYASWLKVKRRARDNFIRIVGDRPIEEITREEARKFWRWWQDRVVAGEVSPNAAARDVGNMRKLFAEWMQHQGRDAPNPFRNLAFKKDADNSRPPFPTEWIRDRILAPGALAALNAEARGIVLALVETGCRPSEICNLPADHIRLDAKVPHISIAPARGLEIKTQSSIRKIPLVGVSLAAMRAHPDGFPRYRDAATNFSAAAMKYFREHDLLPGPRHSIYSLRHSFEKRATEAGLDYGLRCVLMGHATDRPKYGDGGALSWRRDELLKIALPFDPAVV